MDDHVLPSAPASVELDLEQLFLLYAAFCGDLSKTAHSAGMTIAEVDRLAVQHGWPEKIKGLISLNKGQKPGDIERGINRALNFVQAHRCRMFIESVLRAMIADGKKHGEDVLSMFNQIRLNKKGGISGETLSLRPIADLAIALEKVQWMTYQALNDSPQERAKRVEAPKDESSQADVHARIAAALAGMRSTSPAAQLSDGQQTVAESVVEPAKSPEA
jgi:hypothetical protein